METLSVTAFAPNGSNFGFAFMLYTGSALPIWIYHSDERLPTPYAFHSEEVSIQKEASRSLWHQANTLRAVVRHFLNTLIYTSNKCRPYKYKRLGHFP